MTAETAIVALLVVAIIAANLPWMSERVAFVGSPPQGGKPEWIRLVEWLLLFGLVGLVGAGLEYRTQGELQVQGWEFWVMNLSLLPSLPCRGSSIITICAAGCSAGTVAVNVSSLEKAHRSV